ncbi:pre-mRNA cleavage complex 2 protein Pcf11-like [Teleopsis dalmanni]|uniref:pre-mRNA cleavage complex 2 protein Pcf11-like n=1 Tax=Teleopsis dalmanni TaxID=139649 RepID=UPI0018CFDB99|nr:pre-mRNA cleavage complex 2 protein Pcf11-like [Teleopsis dalmanni]
MDMNSKLHKENEDRVAEEYLSSLSDLTCNSKPLINMLTMLAEENIEYASVIVRVVEDHIAKVVPDIKLPILYLIDSIVKNVKSTYVQLFSQCIVNIFCGVFETVNEKVRERMYALRQTWNEVFSAQKLYTLDVKVKRLDVNWPITAQHSQPAIHVNPNFLKTVNVNLAPNQTIQALPTDTSMEEILHAKTRKLLELKKQKLELELEATKKRLEEQEKQLGTAENVLSPVDTHILAPPSVMPQIMPNNMVAPNIVAHHSPAIRPSIYQNTYRHSRPNLIPGSNNLPAQTYPTGINNIGKPKVHPVNPALINTIRHRDPRLARQNQQGQQGLQQHGNRGIQIQPPSNYLHHNEDSKNTEKTSSYRKDSHKTRRTSSGGSGSESKSPTRHSSSRSGRTSSKSSSSSSRDKDRKRSDKNSSSSSGSGSSSDRRKDGGFSSRDKRIAKCDKDEFDITSNSSTHKRKSSSPASPPAKSKEVKRDPRSRSNSNKNRSPSPISGLTKDTDLRSNNDKRIKCNAGHTEKEDIKSSNAAKDLDKSKNSLYYYTSITSHILSKNIKAIFTHLIHFIPLPHPPMPPLPNPNLHLPQMPWQMGTGMPVPPFGNAIPPMMISKVPPPPQPPVSFNIAPASVQQSKKPCNSIDNPQENLVRTITIDSCAKEIRIYDEVAIVFMEMDQPREIRFQPGQRSISIDDETFAMHFNDDYKVVTIKGEPHRMKFGFPSRELYIDDQWYEIFFGGSIIPVPIGKNIRHLQAEGPPPKVNIGPIRRDLVIGKITMIVDAHIVIGIFIDAKLQTFNLGEKQHTIQFADNLLTVLLDGVAADVEFGGLPKSYELGDDKHFIRFSALPEDVEPGKIKIQNMRYVNTNPTETISVETNDSENLVETTASPNQNQSTITPPNTTTESIEVKSEENISTTNDGVVPTNTSVPSIPTDVLSKINIDELLQKLVSTGLLTSTTTSSSTNSTQNSTVKEELTNPDVVEEPIEVIRPIDLAKPETIKLRQSAIVATLFSGMQCSSCGVRFPPEQTIKYSQHLDWHFRQNRRERDSTRKAHSRKWYYELNDWAQYEEIEDLEEREKNFFETQLNEIDANDDVSNQRSINSPAPSCPAGANDVDRCCDMCHEKFEQFYNEEHEEWHLRSAIRVEDKIYHPLCYEDYKTALNPPKVEELKEDSKITEEDDNAVDNVIKITVDEEAAKLSVTIADDEEDDDDDVIVLPNEEPSVTEIVDDDEEYVPANVSREEMAISTDSKSDDKFIETVESDVEIEEPNIPFTDLDTYVEKEPTECDETSQLSFMNVKIKEEPKDEEDDDGFEDVGTVLIRPDEEISVQSSEETQTQTIASTASPATERRPSTESLTLTGIIEPLENTASMDLNISIDGNLEPDVGHNLSISGPTPAIPLSNLVNKIKINITKNTVSTNSNVSVSSSIITTSSSSTSHNNSSNLNSEVNDVNKNSLSHGNISTIQTINTIPVLCGGGATISTIASVVSSNPSKSVNESSKSSNNTALTSNTSDNSTVLRCPQSMSPTTASQRSSPPIEETIKFDFKPELQNVTLKKTKKVECGIETSGLCSIM